MTIEDVLEYVVKPTPPTRRFFSREDEYDKCGEEWDGTPIYKPAVRPTKSYMEYLDDKETYELIIRWKKLKSCLEDQIQRYGDCDELQVQELKWLIRQIEKKNFWRVIDIKPMIQITIEEDK